jgi:protein-tyrosine-phosphatase
MKILFVCWANVGRSQMAEALYNRSIGSNLADSAGTDVDVPGETLQQRKLRRGGTYTIEAMDTEDIDVRNNIRTQLTETMLDQYDQVISMAQKEYTPAWLENHPAYVYWDIKDPGNGKIEDTLKAMNLIKAQLELFLK